VLFLCGLPTAAQEPAAQPREERSGFWLRGNLGHGYARFSTDPWTVSGSAELGSFSIGKFFGDRLVGFVDVAVAVIPGPTLKRGDSTFVAAPTDEETVGGMGLGVGYYLVPNSVFLGGSLGLATESFSIHEEEVNESDPGPALSLVLGKDFVVSDKWTLGVAGHLHLATMTEKARPVRWKTAAGGIDFTFAFAPERFRLSSPPAQDVVSAPGAAPPRAAVLPAGVIAEYNALKKSAWTAGLLEYVIPLVGYSYAGDWRRGLWPTGATVAGILMVSPCLDPCADSAVPWAWAGLMLAGASRIWGIVGAVDTANDHNRALRVRLDIEPLDGGFAVGGYVPFR
jgi:hypothetical protein